MYIRQALAMMREEKLFSGIYIAGTTMALAFTMVMAVVYYIKLAPIYPELNRSLALALFFLLNLILAVVGTVWLHAKRRTEECGVRRAFGATRRRLLLGFLGRGALMATAAVVIGCIIFLNYAYSGLQTDLDGSDYFDTMYYTYYCSTPSDRTWVEAFWPHFLIVSACVYLIILVTVLIGTAIPAWRITRTQITEALREE